MNYGNLYQPILNESQGRPFQQDFNYYAPSIQDCQNGPAPVEQPPSYHHINPNPVEYYQPLPADQEKFNAQPIPAMNNPVSIFIVYNIYMYYGLFSQTTM